MSQTMCHVGRGRGGGSLGGLRQRVRERELLQGVVGDEADDVVLVKGPRPAPLRRAVGDRVGERVVGLDALGGRRRPAKDRRVAEEPPDEVALAVALKAPRDLGRKRVSTSQRFKTVVSRSVSTCFVLDERSSLGESAFLSGVPFENVEANHPRRAPRATTHPKRKTKKWRLLLRRLVCVRRSATFSAKSSTSVASSFSLASPPMTSGESSGGASSTTGRTAGDVGADALRSRSSSPRPVCPSAWRPFGDAGSKSSLASAEASSRKSFRDGPPDLGRTRVIQRRFNLAVPRARVPKQTLTLRDRSER